MFTRLGIDALLTYLYFIVSYISTALLCDYISPRKRIKFDKVKRVLIKNFTALLIFALGVPALINKTFLPSCLGGLGVLEQWFISMVLLEVWFYYSHRLMHYPPLYRLFHKQHHEFLQPYGWTGIYCSIAELFLVNLFSVMVGPLITGMTGWVLFMWSTIISVLTVLGHHSGFNIPFISDGKHDIHHFMFNYNYGIFETLDRLHGTFRNAEVTKK